MKRHKYSALLLFVVVLLSIICFHSGVNLKERVAAPSEMWGRHISLGITDFKKTPSIYTEGTNTIAVFADEKGFQRVQVDRKGFITDNKSINIKDYFPAKLVKYQMAANKLFWTENYDLFYADLKNSQLIKQKLLSDVFDFQLIETGDEIAIVTAAKDSIYMYDFSGDEMTKSKAEAQINDVTYINAAKDGKGNIYITGTSKISPTEYILRLLSYDSSAVSLVERIEPVIIENFTTTREGSNSINNLELGFEDSDIYVFYEIGKASSQGMVAKTYMGRLPKASNKVEKLTFERLKLDGDSEKKETYISSLKCLDGDSDKLSLIMTTPIRTSISREGSELVYMKIDEGNITYKRIATNTGQWNSYATINKLEDQYVASFLQTIGGTRYIVNLTSTAEEYKTNLKKTTMNDIKLSVMDTVGAYVFSVFAIFINLITVSFILLWPIAVDFFEWKYFFKNPLVTFRIGAVAETFLMYFSITKIYSEQNLPFMPDILKHGLSSIGILLITAALSYVIVSLYRKSKRDLHSFPELALFVLIHNIFVYFLLTAYIARF
ncbi:MAG: hypothetical protein ACYCYE_16555 [Clostridia bacterium]